MKKRALVLLLAAALLAGLLSGCAAYDDLMYGLYTLLGGDTTQDAASPGGTTASASTSLPAASTGGQSTDGAAAEEDGSEPAAPDETPQLNEELLSLLGATNEELIALLGTGGLSYVMYGGSAVADYTGENVALPAAFFLDAAQDEMLEVYFSHTDSGEVIAGNIWPGHFTVGFIEAYGDGLAVLFPGDLPSYQQLCAHFGLQPELQFTAANEGMDYTYPMDTWYCEFSTGGRIYAITFEETSGNKVPLNARVFAA